MNPATRIAIVHPWFPEYRLAFFTSLIAQAAEQGIHVGVFHGDAPPEWRERGDSVTAPYAQKLSTRFFPLAGRSLSHKSLRSLPPREYQGLVLEQAVRNVETYGAIARRRPQVALWGHGRTYTQEVSAPQEVAKMWLTRRADWFFAYTRGGAEAVEANGFDSRRITIVQNSVDTRQLADDCARVTQEQLVETARALDLRGQTALFLGGLDAAKRLDFLIESGREVSGHFPDFRLVIAGDGDLRHYIEGMAARYRWVKYVGRATGAAKARLLVSSQVIAMPGRVGLVAVDSFASGVPIVATDWQFHAPEYEYLEPDVSALITPNSPHDYALGLMRVLADSNLLLRLSEGAKGASPNYSVERMANNFVMGLTAWRDVNDREANGA